MFARIKKNNKLIAVIASLIGMFLFFVGGMFSSNTQLEKISDYVTNVVVNQTRNKSLCALTIGKSKDGEQIPNADFEFHNTYGTFMQQRIAFASTVNSDKEIDIKFDNINTGNLSFLYGGAVGTIPYDGHYLHNTLPVELMFVDERMYDISNYVVYISQGQADSILDSDNVPRQENGFHTSDEYKSLLKQIVPISVDGVSSKFVIQNIYFENNYYCSSLSEVMGDFLIFSYHLPGELRSQQRNMYFMDEYVYHNRYFMNYINNAYPSHNYSLKINHYNIVGEIDENYFLSFYAKEVKGQDWVNSLCVAIAIILLALSIFLIFFVGAKGNNTIGYTILQLAVLFIPYLIFSLLFKVTGNVSYLSETACKANLFAILIFAAVFMFFSIYGGWFSRKRTPKVKDSYEISI